MLIEMLWYDTYSILIVIMSLGGTGGSGSKGLSDFSQEVKI